MGGDLVTTPEFSQYGEPAYSLNLEDLMLKLRLATIAILVAVFGLVSVSSASAQYAPCSVDLDVDEDSFSGQAESSLDGGTFEIFNDYNGETDSGGNPTNFNFSSPDDEEDEVTITAVYTIVGGPSCQSSVTIELDEDEDGDGDGDGDGDEDKSGGLPDTGGSNQTVILAGVALILVGGGTIYLARRRNEDTV
jgi:LPXTG-motif cell wall-anchored protein